jgi:hypothetical protein
MSTFEYAPPSRIIANQIPATSAARITTSPDDAAAARLAVCAHARDAADAGELMAALGILPGGGE